DKHTAKPMHISDKEAERILHQVQEGVERPKPSVTFEIGEQVRVSDGPFASFNGFVQEVDEERARLKVEVSIFGRAVPVDLEFGQVERSCSGSCGASRMQAAVFCRVNRWEVRPASAGRSNRTTGLQPPDR